MQYINELSEQEILKLTQDELDRMVKFKMAQDGLKFYIRPEEPKYHELPDADIEVYQVNDVQFTFFKQEDALKVAKLLKEIESNLYERSWSSDEVLKPMSVWDKERLGNIDTKRIYSVELWSQVSAKKKENEANKKHYESLLKQYEDAYSESEYVRTEVYGRFNEVKEKYANFELSLANFSTYLEIANGDFKQAMAFFTKAYEPDSETIQYVENHYKKETEAPAPKVRKSKK